MRDRLPMEGVVALVVARSGDAIDYRRVLQARLAGLGATVAGRFGREVTHIVFRSGGSARSIVPEVCKAHSQLSVGCWCRLSAVSGAGCQCFFVRQRACRLRCSKCITAAYDTRVLREHRRDRSSEREAEDVHLRELYERVAKVAASP